MQVINLFFKCSRQCLVKAAGVGGSLCVYFCRSLSSSFPAGFIFFFPIPSIPVFRSSCRHTQRHTHTHCSRPQEKSFNQFDCVGKHVGVRDTARNRKRTRDAYRGRKHKSWRMMRLLESMSSSAIFVGRNVSRCRPSTVKTVKCICPREP